MISAVLFDLDETLIDRQAAVRVFCETLSALNLGPSLASLTDTVEQLDAYGYTPRAEFFSALADAWALSEKQLEFVRNLFFQSVWTTPILMPGTVEGIQSLLDADIKVAIVSNGSTEAQMAKLKYSGLDQLVKTCVISEAMGIKKPDPAIFLAAIHQLGVEPESSWFVGDHPKNDIWGGKQLGFKTAWVHRNRAWPDELTPCFDFQSEDVAGVFAHLMSDPA